MNTSDLLANQQAFSVFIEIYFFSSHPVEVSVVKKMKPYKQQFERTSNSID